MVTFDRLIAAHVAITSDPTTTTSSPDFGSEPQLRHRSVSILRLVSSWLAGAGPPMVAKYLPIRAEACFYAWASGFLALVSQWQDSAREVSVLQVAGFTQFLVTSALPIFNRLDRLICRFFFPGQRKGSGKLVGSRPRVASCRRLRSRRREVGKPGVSPWFRLIPTKACQENIREGVYTSMGIP